MNISRYRLYLTIIVFLSFILPGCVTEGEMPIESYQFQTVAPDTIINPTSDYIVVIGDIQESTYSFDNLYYLTYSLDWIRCQNNYYKNICCVLQDGDVTNHNVKWQWDMAQEAFYHLKDSTMYVWSTGNHDYTWGGDNGTTISDRSSPMLDIYMANSPLLDRNIVSRYEQDSYHNIVVKNIVNGERLDIISLEFGPRPDVVSWVAEHVKSNPGRKFILMTHEYMTSTGKRVSKGKSYAELQFKDIPYSEPEYIWENLVRPNDNIICVVNGHNGFCKYLETENDAGRMVPQILFNLQYQVNGGDSMIQLWEFPKDENRVNITVYNTLKRSLADPESNSFTFTY